VLNQQKPQADTRWLGGYVGKHWRSAIAATIFSLFAGITSALEPYIVGIIIDRLSAPDQIRTQLTSILPARPIFGEFLAQRSEATLLNDVVGLILLIIGVALVTIVAFFGQRYFSGNVAYGVNFDVRRDLFDNLLTREQAFYQAYPVGDLISRMHADIVLIWQLIVIIFMRFGSAFFTLIATFVLLGLVNLPLTLVVFVVLTVSTSLQIRAGVAIARLFEEVQDQAGIVSALGQDTISGIQTIKTTGKEAEFSAKYYEELREYRRRWLFFKRRNEPVGMLPNMISETTAAIVVLVGGVMALNGSLSLGDFASFLLYLAMISTVLLQIGTVYQRYQQTRGALVRLTPLLQPAEIASKPEAVSVPDIRGDIRFENVSVELAGTTLLKSISLHIPAGQTVALVGPTGCGKTLLVSLLARVLDPTSGRILLDGVDIRDLDLEELRKSIAYVPQTTFLFSQPLHENVRMNDDAIDEARLNQAIHISRMSNDLPQLPLGLDTLVGERGVMLSGGQKQRVAIARAVVREPSILVLDDAFSSVDTQTAADILGDLHSVLDRCTSIIIAHRIATVKDADNIIVMSEGEIIQEGTHQQLVKQRGLYAEMVEREFKEEADVIYEDDE
jgi:ATP-binding cassette, subfamily B, multidrug efflux pump